MQFVRSIFISFFVLIIFLSTAFSEVFATALFQEDFSTNSFDQWQLENGEWQYWSIHDGALYATINKSRKLSTLVPKEEKWLGLDNYRVEFLFQAFNTTDKNFVLGWFDPTNFYDIHFYNNQLIVEEIRDGLSIQAITLPLPLQLNHKYQVVAEYSHFGIKLWMDGELVFVTNEEWLPPREGGRFGVKIATGGVAYSAAWFDEITAWSLFPRQLLFLQTDPQWASQRYDHHDSTLNGSDIATWGCALSAAAMLLRSHGFLVLPDGQIITPASLNEWLRSQADGYIANGLVNWLAVTRLTKLLSDVSGTKLPKLEFRHYPITNWSSDQLFLQESLTQLGPQIGTDGDHFFVLDSYDVSTADFSLRDPLYPQQWLGQKSKPMTSLRIFRPSQTDLSYLLLVLPKTMQARLVNELSQELPDSLLVQETLDSAIDSDQSLRLGEAIQLLYYRQPAEQLYRIVVTSESFSQADLEHMALYLYQVDGTVQVVKFLELIDIDQLDPTQLKQLVVEIDFTKTTPAVISVQSILKTKTELDQAYLQEVGTQAAADFAAGRLSFYVWYKLTHLLTFLHREPRYLYLLDRFRDFHQL